MTNFETYAQYYDLLYSDKNYTGEADYVESLLQKNTTEKITTILNLGCGTGKHDLLIAEKGYDVTGVDLSEQMIAEANKAAQQKKGIKTSFYTGDARTFRTDRRFDAVISLFHVASYQTGNKDILQYLDTAANHLNTGGLFVFDCWYGPAVLTDPPVVRVKRLKNDQIAVTRIAEPVIHPNANVVDVNYEVAIYDNQNKPMGSFREKHPMRYFFYPETALLLETSGFEIIGFEEWMTGNAPGLNSWNVVFICRKK